LGCAFAVIIEPIAIPPTAPSAAAPIASPVLEPLSLLLLPPPPFQFESPMLLLTVFMVELCIDSSVFSLFSWSSFASLYCACCCSSLLAL